MFRSVMKSDPAHDTLRFFSPECFEKRFFKMRIEIVENNMNFFRFSVYREIDDSLDFVRKVLFCPPFRYRRFPMSALRLHGDENISRSVPFVFIIASSRFLRLRVFCRSRFFEKLFALFIETENGLFRIVRFCVECENVFHSFDIFRRKIRDTPHFFPTTA